MFTGVEYNEDRRKIDQEGDDGLQPVIQIAIMDHTLFPDHRRFFTKYELQDDEGYRFSDKLQFYVMDLTAKEDAEEDEKANGLVDWAEAFTALGGLMTATAGAILTMKSFCCRKENA